MKVAYVKWLDAAGTAENIWQSLDTLPSDLIEVQSAGIVIDETDTTVTLINSKTSISFMGDITIPKISILVRKDFEIK